MAVVHRFPSYGVIHADMRSDNILMTPTRAVVIDFGQAIIRKTDMDDDTWTERVTDEDEVEALRRILHGRGVRDRTPYYPPSGPGSGVRFNRNMEREGESWRKRWYNEMPLKAHVSVSGQHERKNEPVKWELKGNVQTWLNSRPAPPEAFTIARPGSPYWKQGFSCEEPI